LLKLALCGKLRSGKDTVAAHLCGSYGFWEYSFATALKDVAKRLYPTKFNSKPRALLQQLGEWLCEFDPDIFIDATFQKIHNDRQWLDGITRIVITDLRKTYEYERLRAEGFTIIRVNAPLELRLQRALEAGDNFTLDDLNHPTETAVDGFDVDYEVTNDGSLDHLWSQVDEIMADMGVEPMRERPKFD